MNNIKLIKTEKDYEEALERINSLMDAAPGSDQEEELELMSLLVEKYEEEHLPIDPPDPVEAILFRMEQQDLTAKDMIKYLGSQSKVSEVLNHKRPLSLTMIRNLHEGLGIPAEVLLQQPVDQEPDEQSLQKNLISQEAIYYTCSHLAQELNKAPLKDWRLKTSEKVLKQKLPPFDWEGVNKSLLVELVRLGSYSAGPQMAHELLNKKGIHIVVQKISFDAELDGACFFSPEERPVISLTLRDNRLDAFWFTLLHLLAHLYLHRSEKHITFFDSIECVFDKTASAEEKRVNRLLKATLASTTSKKSSIESYLHIGDADSLNQVVQSLDISPEILSCWVRLEKEGKESAIPFTHKKVNEKLEVYG